MLEKNWYFDYYSEIFLFSITALDASFFPKAWMLLKFVKSRFEKKMVEFYFPHVLDVSIKDLSKLWNRNGGNDKSFRALLRTINSSLTENQSKIQFNQPKDERDVMPYQIRHKNHTQQHTFSIILFVTSFSSFNFHCHPINCVWL